MRGSLKERFMAKVSMEPMSGCWLWTGAAGPEGYGYLGRGAGKSLRAHRVSWELFHAPILGGLHVLHRCDTPACVNPGHLFLGTNADNVADRMSKGRHRVLSGDRHWAKRKPERIRRGSRNGLAKLTEADVAEIRRRYGGGERQKHLAPEFGVTQTAVSLIVLRKTWRHVP